MMMTKTKMCVESVETEATLRILFDILALVVEVSNLFIRIVFFNGLIIVMLALAR